LKTETHCFSAIVYGRGRNKSLYWKCHLVCLFVCLFVADTGRSVASLSCALFKSKPSRSYSCNEIPIGNFSLPTDSKITRGISVMNIPIGTDEYTQKFLQSKLDEISKDITTIMQVEKLHNRWSYIYYILNGKINYLYIRKTSQWSWLQDLNISNQFDSRLAWH